MPRDTTVGAILVGGASRRMGAPKHAVTWHDGRAMLEHVAEALAPLCREIVLLGVADPMPAGYRSLPDRRPGEGPLAGIEALLAEVPAERCLVCPCDVPRVTTALLSVLAAPGRGGATVLRVEGEDEPRPLPACFTREALPVVTAALDAGRRSVRGVMGELGAEARVVPAEWATLLHNINEPGDV